ncbi:hypothetical protein V5735_03725 (plasmid) [Haladaptatus sp. SPP-AMP-3]|uniref:hypothetical protein n=1 Tax=Haladaptatus sp. SPP-AMP-3 TaxID=3121295 RepID=UPI003C2D28F3
MSANGVERANGNPNGTAVRGSRDKNGDDSRTTSDDTGRNRTVGKAVGGSNTENVDTSSESKKNDATVASVGDGDSVSSNGTEGEANDEVKSNGNEAGPNDG